MGTCTSLTRYYPALPRTRVSKPRTRVDTRVRGGPARLPLKPARLPLGRRAGKPPRTRASTRGGRERQAAVNIQDSARGSSLRGSRLRGGSLSGNSLYGSIPDGWSLFDRVVPQGG